MSKTWNLLSTVRIKKNSLVFEQAVSMNVQIGLVEGQDWVNQASTWTANNNYL